jgi:hypothetical protein
MQCALNHKRVHIQERGMSLLEVKIIEGGDFTPKMKRKRTRKRTGTNGSIDGEKLRPYVLVVLEKVRRAQWA